MIAADAVAAITLFALDPLGAGLILRGAASDARTAVLVGIKSANPSLTLRRVPVHVTTGRLVGETDLGASLAAGRPIQSIGLLDAAEPSALVLPMAERWEPARAALISRALDLGAPIGLIALDESASPDESLNAGLTDRCAFHIDLAALPEDFVCTPDPEALQEARALLPRIAVADPIIEALCQAAVTLGIDSLRAGVLAVRCARGLAALAGRDHVDQDDAAAAARLVLSSRATRAPAPPEMNEEEPSDSEQPQTPPDSAPAPDADDTEDAAQQDGSLDDLVLEAARVALPAHLLAGAAQATKRAAQTPGRAGVQAAGTARGRPIGSRPGIPRDGKRLDLMASLRAGAAWQVVRGRTPEDQRMRLRADDLRVMRCKPKTATTTIFAVDASGSLALARLADAKGAVELLLAECYVRRDTVALIAFRGTTAELLLPPTRAPARARRSLSALAGGGGTPLSMGIDAAAAVAEAAARRGETPTIVLLTDGQGNIGRDGKPGRAAAQLDALASARAVRDRRHRTLLIDTSPRRQPVVQTLAEALGARYIPLPRADAQAMSNAVRAGRA
jgi:magnesium chelatase subunit D